MYENKTYLYLWSDVNPNENGTATVEEYVSLDFEIAFPIQTTNDEESIYHLTLEDALGNGYDYIIVNEDITIDEDLVIPEGKVLEISEDVTVTLDDAKIKSEGGIILSSGTVVDGNIEYYNVLVALKDGEDYAVEAYLVAKGEKVAIPTKEGYKVTDVKVYNADDEEITVTDGSFIMPGETVAIEGTLVKETVEENIKDVPNTGDSVAIFVIIV